MGAKLDFIRGSGDFMCRSPDSEVRQGIVPMEVDSATAETSKLTCSTDQVFKQVRPGPSSPSTQESANVARTFTPFTAMSKFVGQKCTVEYAEALHTLNAGYKLPSTLTPTTALKFISEVENGRRQPEVRKMAFDALINALKKKTEPLLDYCKVVWLVAQDSKPSFLTESQCRKLRQFGPFGPFARDTFVPPKLNQAELDKLIKTLEERNCNDENGIGPIQTSFMADVMENWQEKGGDVFRVVTDESPRKVTLRVTSVEDIHQFCTYCEFLKGGVLTPLAVRGHTKFSMPIGRIEISSRELPIPQKTLDSLRRKNPSLEISYNPVGFTDRRLEASGNTILLFPPNVQLDTSSYFPR